MIVGLASHRGGVPAALRPAAASRSQAVPEFEFKLEFESLDSWQLSQPPLLPTLHAAGSSLPAAYAWLLQTAALLVPL